MKHWFSCSSLSATDTNNVRINTFRIANSKFIQPQTLHLEQHP